MDLSARLALLPESVRAGILHAVCAGAAPPARATLVRPELSAPQGSDLGGASSPAHLPTLPRLDSLQLLAGACVLDNFISQELVEDAHADALRALADSQQQAAIGGALPLQAEGRPLDSQARGDVMRWLHPAHEEAAGRAALAEVLRRMEAVRQRLERQGYDVGGRPTFQLACYPGGGARYVRHADASLSCPTRSATAILYLNQPGWQPQSDGGCLALYNVPYSGPAVGAGVGGGEPATLVAPLGGRLLVFEAHLFHEVLPAHRHRYAVTAWFHRRPPSGSALRAAAAPPPPQQQQHQAGEQQRQGQEAGEQQRQASAHPAEAGAAVAAEGQRGGRAGVAASTAQPAGSEAEAVQPHGADTHAHGGVRPAGCEGAAVAAAAEGSRGGGGQPPAASPSPTNGPRASPAAAAASASTTAAASASTTAAASASTTAAASASTTAASASASVAASASTTAASASASVAASAPTSAAAVAAAAAGPLPRIFVSIAAYRDPECQWTVHSLLSGADHPHRVHVGVVWQVDQVEDAVFVRVAGARAHPEWLKQVRHIILPHGEATGPCKARALAASLWGGEEYVLQLDSHMRMAPGWDTLCIQQLAEAEALSATGKAVLSTYPLGYSGDGAAASVPDAATAPVTLLCAQRFGPDGMLRSVGRCLRRRPRHPLPASAWAAGLSFARSAWLQEVPYCPHLPQLFFGEEPYMLARMWTRGWDVYAPAVPLAFHQWERAARAHTFQRARSAVHEAVQEAAAVLRRSSEARVLRVLGCTAARASGGTTGSGVPAGVGCGGGGGDADEEWPVGHMWGLGTDRTLEQLEAATGLSFATRQCPKDPAQTGDLDPSLPGGMLPGGK